MDDKGAGTGWILLEILSFYSSFKDAFSRYVLVEDSARSFDCIK